MYDILTCGGLICKVCPGKKLAVPRKRDPIAKNAQQSTLHKFLV